jgi:alpha-L-rhamnosidase
MFEMATKKDYPSWGDMLGRGATTVWEAWDGRNSLLHSSYLHIGAWFIEGLGGIRPDPAGPGYKRFIIKPGVPDDGLDWVKTQFESPHGLIRSHWRIDDGTFTLNITVPPNTTATVFTPTNKPRSLRESGSPLARARCVKRLRNENGRVVLEVQPGRYTFKGALE